jgi:NAD(P)-dependent dehydrogenase (short-subunit alcohol dehydrogenase family)
MPEPRIAIVTGSANGIGREIALRLSEDGCHLILNDLLGQSAQLHSLVKEIEAKGRKAVACIGDISVEEDVQKLIDVAVLSFGGLDIVSSGVAWLS